MQFCNFRMIQFVFSPEYIRHPSLLVLFAVSTCLPCSFGALVPANGRVSSLLILCCHIPFADAVSPFLFSIGCFAVRGLAISVQLSAVVLAAGGGAVGCCLPGGNGSHRGRTSVVAVSSTWLWKLPCLSCAWSLTQIALCFIFKVYLWGFVQLCSFHTSF